MYSQVGRIFFRVSAQVRLACARVPGCRLAFRLVVVLAAVSLRIRNFLWVIQMGG